MYKKKVRFSLPQTIKIKDYSLGYKVNIPYNPYLCLDSIQRFKQISSKSHLIYSNSKAGRVCLQTPIGKQNISEGDILHIIPRKCR